MSARDPVTELIETPLDERIHPPEAETTGYSIKMQVSRIKKIRENLISGQKNSAAELNPTRKDIIRSLYFMKLLFKTETDRSKIIRVTNAAS